MGSWHLEQQVAQTQTHQTVFFCRAFRYIIVIVSTLHEDMFTLDYSLIPLPTHAPTSAIDVTDRWAHMHILLR